MSNALPYPTRPNIQVSAGALIWWTFVTFVVVGGGMSGVMMLVDSPEWWTGFVAASLIAAPAGAIGLFPLLLVSLRGSAAQIPLAFLAGMLLRMMTAVALLIMSLYVYKTPKMPTGMLMLAYYCAMLGTEVGVLVVQMRRPASTH